jgi:aminoglycoside 6'-N-acetyltransferase I
MPRVRAAVSIVRARPPQHPAWLELRRALWPECSLREHRGEMAALAAARRWRVLLAIDAAGEVLGFAEASLRRDPVNGTTSSPVGFLEGVYVVPAARRRGVARALVQAAEQWSRQAGCREFASDAYLRNRASHAMHYALGFVETERVVYFRKPLRR